jgi:cytoskeletal protein RodZ
LSPEDIAKSLYLTVSHVIALEADDYRNSHGLTFERGYLRAYARLVDLEEDSVVADFNELGLEDKFSPPPLFFHGDSRKIRTGHGRWVIYLVAFAFSILLVMWWQLQNSNFEFSKHGFAQHFSGKTRTPNEILSSHGEGSYLTPLKPLAISPDSAESEPTQES